MSLIIAFLLGLAVAWVIRNIAWNMAFGTRKIGGQARQKWLSKLDYEALLRTKKQIDDEIAKRQP